jgi:phage terminase large subunit-like protein
VVAGLGEDGRGYVLADLTVDGARPMVWAEKVVAAYRRFLADRVVAEVNQGGELVATVIRQVDATIPVREVRAMRGKWLRAEPVAALYEQGRIAHGGALAELEDEMNDFGPDGLSGGRSPDRVDALVWAITDLMLQVPPEPRIRAM